jgi:replicative DNA helicase
VTAIDLAENATVGALLLAPQEIRPVGTWLRPSDFSDTWLGGLYQLLRERHTAGLDCDPTSVGHALSASRPPHAARLPRIADVLASAPVNPQPQAYARLVLELGIRREVRGYGVLIRAGALASAVQRDLTPMRESTGLVRGHIEGAETRWSLAHGHVRPQPSSVEADDARWLGILSGADRFLASQPPHTAEQVVEHERTLAASLVIRPQAAEAAGAVVRPEWFHSREWGAVYAAVLDLSARGRSVDPVTVPWEVQRAALVQGPGPEYGDFTAAVEAALVTDPSHALATVSADLLRRTADAAAHSLETGASNPGLTVPDLLHTGRVLLAATETAGRGLSGLRQPGPEAVGGTLTASRALDTLHVGAAR